MKTSNGFSLIEMLAATVLLSILITVVLSPLAQLFEKAGDSGQTLRVTTQTQEIVEAIRGQWRSYPVIWNTAATDPNRTARDASLLRYARTCGTLPAINNGITITVTVRGLDRYGNVLSNLAYGSACNAAIDLSEIKRVTVTGRATDGTQTSFVVDVPRPCIDVNTTVTPPVCRDSQNILNQATGAAL